MEKREITCINCPMGCSLEVTMEGGEVTDVKGYTCKRGLDYAKTECTDPRRIVTSTVRLAHPSQRTISVKTEKPIPKDKIYDCILAIKDIELKSPVAIGDVVLPNVCGTDTNIIATSGCKN